MNSVASVLRALLGKAMPNVRSPPLSSSGMFHVVNAMPVPASVYGLGFCARQLHVTGVHVSDGVGLLGGGTYMWWLRLRLGVCGLSVPWYQYVGL